ncbi:hypothetical protein HK100_001948 [Physocladia obscura]|uniref:Ras-GEF domain-containing protein n=1 Tax=Physocladia obscura TaxID=109957 RepID=A0AAD5SX72_9FUNG|nr:hypothetical protein HK100_001948 [Physocladia obscura]
MSLFGLGIIGLTLPSLVSQNYARLGLSKPPITQSVIAKTMLLRISVTDSLQDMRIISPLYTIITHMFYHKDLSHWFSNIYALVVLTSGTESTLQSLLSMAFTFFGGGIGGVLGHIVYATVVTRRNAAANENLRSIDKAQDSFAAGIKWGVGFITGNPNATAIELPKISSFFRERTCIVCGASAGVYALMGAECVRLSIRLYAELNKLARINRRPYLDNLAIHERKLVHSNIVSILTVAIGHAVAIGSQVVAVSGLIGQAKSNDGYSIISPATQPTNSVPFLNIDETVGYAAHLGLNQKQMDKIDRAIQKADTLLSRGNQSLAYQCYFKAIQLIADHMLQNTTFEASADPESETQTRRHKIKNTVVAKPKDSQRLFGLAHLWLVSVPDDSFQKKNSFTEVEDIVEGSVNTEDFDSDYDEENDEDDDESVDEESLCGVDDTISDSHEGRSVEITATPPDLAATANSTIALEADNQSITIAALPIPTLMQDTPVLPQKNLPNTTTATLQLNSPAISNGIMMAISNSQQSGSKRSEKSNSTSGILEQSDFRQQRLSHPRSLCNSVRSTVRLSILALNTTNTPSSAASSQPTSPELSAFSPSVTFADTNEYILDHEFTATTASSGVSGVPNVPLPVFNHSNLVIVTQEAKPIKEQTQTIIGPSIIDKQEKEEITEARNINAFIKSPEHDNTDKPLKKPPAEKLPYIPLIPTSPLQHQHTHIVQSYSRCVQELERINSSRTTSGQQALQTLSVVRRLMETTTLLKNKQAQVAGEISQWNSKEFLDIAPKLLAINIHLCDWDLFSTLITIDDLMVYSAATIPNNATFFGGGSDEQILPPLPRSFKSCIDFSIFISRLVSSTILTAASKTLSPSPYANNTPNKATVSNFLSPKPHVLSSSASSASLSSLLSTTSSLASTTATIAVILPENSTATVKTISQWLQVLAILHFLRNYQSMYAIVSGFRHPAVANVLFSTPTTTITTATNQQSQSQTIWSKIPPKLRLIFENASTIVSTTTANDSAYRRATNSTARTPLVPLLGVFLDDLKKHRTSLSSSSSLAVTRFVALQGDFERWKCATNSADGLCAAAAAEATSTESCYTKEKSDRNAGVLHWILSREWVGEERLWEMSLVATAASGGGVVFGEEALLIDVDGEKKIKQRLNFGSGSKIFGKLIKKATTGHKIGGSSSGVLEDDGGLVLSSSASIMSSLTGSALLFSHDDRDLNDHVYEEYYKNLDAAAAAAASAGAFTSVGVAQTANGDAAKFESRQADFQISPHSSTSSISSTMTTPTPTPVPSADEKLSIDNLRARLEMLKRK